VQQQPWQLLLLFTAAYLSSSTTDPLLKQSQPTIRQCLPDNQLTFQHAYVNILFLRKPQRNLNGTEIRYLEDEFQDAYNYISDGCYDVYQRNMTDAVMVESNINTVKDKAVAFSNNGNISVNPTTSNDVIHQSLLTSNWNATVHCDKENCPTQQALFGGDPSKTNNTTKNNNNTTTTSNNNNNKR
jgi:hypothetical protein